MNTLTETERAYLAGFFDGEGCVSITKQISKESRNPYYHLSLVVSQCNYEFLKFWRDRIGLGSINEKRYITPGINAAPTWDWRVHTKEAAALLKLILPYLRIKKTEAELAISFQEGIETPRGGRGWQVPAEITAEREKVYQLMHQLKSNSSNKRGSRRKRLELYNDGR